ncbi:hypothetical protein WICMUC_001605 [Wickerhamomyces mucosus]|uniref:Histone-binding protein RBBP4 N-terminal domain-containing protein n=1 Tax=Wickerhamomyces mucosus TaxID=1378264 RepID=A0A9P8PU12_9ASCO|nr:hypothetical protein WICMUC_001605 [Wickerhamomyces mucosus]
MLTQDQYYIDIKGKNICSEPKAKEHIVNPYTTMTDVLDSNLLKNGTLSNTVEQEEETSPIDSQTQENYRKWKANSIQLYDYLNTVNSIWPSWTVQFFPDREINRNKRPIYRLLTGTYTSGQMDEYVQLGNFTVKDDIELVDLNKYDHDSQEFNSSDPIVGKFQNIQKFLHRGEINKLRYLPQNPNLISSINDKGHVHIFDKTKLPSLPVDDFRFEMSLQYHKDEGFGLNWNNNKEGVLLTSSMDGTTATWDITKFSKSAPVITTPIHAYKTDEKGTNDCQWNPLHDSIFATVGEDNNVKIFDERKQGNELIRSNNKLHSGGINALSFNNHNSFALSTADSDGKLNIWDLRAIASPIFEITSAHQGSISSVKFNPNKPELLATAGSDDSIVNIWNLSREPKDQLVFKHAGHMLGVNEVAWNPNDYRMISSVSNDNTVHIWKPSKQFI